MNDIVYERSRYCMYDGENISVSIDPNSSLIIRVISTIMICIPQVFSRRGSKEQKLKELEPAANVL